MKPKYKKFLIFFVLPLLLVGLWTLSTVVAQTTRTCVCHVEDKKSGDGHVIEVDDSSLQGHLNHGDSQCTDCTNVGNACNTSSGATCTEGT